MKTPELKPKRNGRVRPSELVSRRGLKTLTCLNCGGKFTARSRKFCCDCCREAYELKHSDPYAGIQNSCSIYRAKMDYEGEPWD